MCKTTYTRSNTMLMINNNASAMKPSCIKKRTNTKKQLRTRHVGFTDRVSVQNVAPKEEMDKELLWYSLQTYQQIIHDTMPQQCLLEWLMEIDEIASTLSTIISSATQKTVDVRGLTDMDGNGNGDGQEFITRRQHVVETIDAILDVQVHQWADGDRDPEQLAAVSRRYSMPSQLRALQRAAGVI